MNDERLSDVAARYTVQTTDFLERLMEGAAADDPLARQFRPSLAELVTAPDDLADPIGDDDRSPLPGLVHRYPDRVLLLPVKVCAAYCRFCFRRAVVGRGAQPLTAEETAAALDYVRARPAIKEVILSGGDPLLLSPRRLGALVAALDAIPHVEVLRVHSRLPVHDPGRVTAELAAALAGSDRLAPWLAVHVNHAREFAPEVVAALGRLRRAGVSLVSQSVLLRGVNDDVDTLEALFRACVRHGVKPYYLHHPDRAEGTSHFRMSIDEGRALVAALHARLSGLARPTYVLDRPGGLGKVPLGPWPDPGSL
ncbi:lysine-2,3-aminomutase-like protein [Novispirillum sp. DQ9]|uniref:lysine-2,3-aminomutase-like protein n=1 Tax=Novispirillum sp. DQ9 TaxID=3398612 RepID=UPI003C7E1591